MMDTGLDALEWISEGYDRGAGILVLNSIDTDGVKAGYDIEMLKAAGEVTDAKIVASGGAGKMQDFKEALMLPKVEVSMDRIRTDAVLMRPIADGHCRSMMAPA